MVHMIMMSTEHDYRPGSPQYIWLENDLKNVDRSKTPFVMVGGHRPMYCSESVYCKLKVVKMVLTILSVYKDKKYQ